MTLDVNGSTFELTSVAYDSFTTSWGDYQPRPLDPKRAPRTVRRLLAKAWSGRVYPEERAEFAMTLGEEAARIRTVINVGWKFFLLDGDNKKCTVVGIARIKK